MAFIMLVPEIIHLAPTEINKEHIRFILLQPTEGSVSSYQSDNNEHQEDKEYNFGN